MTEDTRKRMLVKFAGLSIGVLLGAILGPLLFRSIDPLATMAASLLGAVLGYLVAVAILRMRARRIDQELLEAAAAVKREAGLPPTITIKVSDGRVVLEGTVETPAESRRAEEAIATLPWKREIINRIRPQIAA